MKSTIEAATKFIYPYLWPKLSILLCAQAMTNLDPTPGEAVLAPTLARSQPVHGEVDSVRCLVREATRNDHLRIDRAMSSLQLTDRVSYSIFLNVHYRALRALAGRWRARDQADFSVLSLCLVDDLQTLECPVSRLVGTARRAEPNLLHQWGIAYVIRGSRLGGAILRQRVPATYPTSYLAYALNITWPEFLKQFDHETQAIDREAHGQIIRGAKQAFEAFTAAAVSFGLRNE
ncbi:MAG TPA: biliverdin-producing heme oxygenase [Steroidobacteraceae bacterium]|nr:biliverdin-producing heme oxygenase [Steroidobacteraceae bacterium]